MEKFIKQCKPNKMKKEELAKWLYEHQTEMISFFIKKGFYKDQQPLVMSLYSKMEHEKFPKALKYIIKKGKKDENSDIRLEPGFAVIINGFLENVNRKEDKDMFADLCEEYTEIIEKILGKKAKKIAKDTDIEKDIILEVLSIAPSEEYIKNEKAVAFAVQKILRKLYALAKDADLGIEKTSQFKKMFSKVFNKELLDVVAINILLERKEHSKNYNETQLNVWNKLTDFALETLEKQKKGHILELLKFYAKRRMMDEKNKKDAARRMVLVTLPDDVYPNINKALKKLNERTLKYL